MGRRFNGRLRHSLHVDHMHRVYDRLWDDSDIPAHALMVDKVHSHGALAAVELSHVSIHSLPFYNRIPSLAAGSVKGSAIDMPVQSRAMDRRT